MFDNHVYNVMKQLTEEHKSLWRIQKMYKKDAKSCKACKAVWQKMEKEKHAAIKELQAVLKHHMK